MDEKNVIKELTSILATSAFYSPKTGYMSNLKTTLADIQSYHVSYVQKLTGLVTSYQGQSSDKGCSSPQEYQSQPALQPAVQHPLQPT